MKRKYNKQKNQRRDTRSIRLQLGLTQQQLADFLCIERGTIAMVECGKRTLPGKAVLKLEELSRFLPGKEDKAMQDASVHKQTQQQNEKAAKKLKDHATRCMDRICILERKLEKLKSSIDKGKYHMHSFTIDQDRNEVSNKVWFQVMQIEAFKKLERFSVQDQLFLELRIAVLKFESQCALEMAENLRLINR